jgi:hypothetical protein
MPGDNDLPAYDAAPRWIADLKTGELFERQSDNSYKATYRLIPLSD